MSEGAGAVLPPVSEGAVRPYLSVVVTARNDDHGGNPLYRMQLFLNGLIVQCDRHRLPAELVLVEWNPPADRPRLVDVLEWPHNEGFCRVRIIEVPPELHLRLDHSDRLPLFQMIGKNVGIRRAHGEFVLATNIDILLSDELMGFLARRRLQSGYVYRLDRFDVPAELDVAWPIEQQLEFCRANVLRVNRREGTLDMRSGDFYRIYPELKLLSWLRNSRAGERVRRSRIGRLLRLERLGLLSAEPHHGIRGRLRDATLFAHVWNSRMRRWWWIWLLMARYLVTRTYAFCYWFVAGFNHPRLVPARIARRLRRALHAVAVEVPGADEGGPLARGRHPMLVAVALPVLIARAAARSLRLRLQRFQKSWAFERARVRLHTNASGDFTLMSAEDWATTVGYAELQMYSMHIDGLQLYLAHYHGIRERFMPFAVYHIEHGGGFRPEAKGDESLDASLAQRAIPQISNRQLMDWICEMYVTKSPLSFNEPDWGFADARLPETTPQAIQQLAQTQTEVA